MNNFKRENRYVVFKRKNLSHAQGKVLHSVESELCPDGNVKECLVVEHDWPCYDAAWNMIVKLSEGEFSDPYAEITQLRERVKELEDENTNGNAAAELLIWWAQKLSNAPNEDLKEVLRIGYKRIVNLANLIGEEQLRKGGE